MWLEVPAWVAWLTAAMRTMLELWCQLMTVPLLPAIPLFASEQAAEVTWITQRSNCIQLYSRAWCLIWRSPRELEWWTLPTDRRNTLPTQWCHHAGHFITASRAQCACVRLHSVAATVTWYVVNPTLQIRPSDIAAQLPFHLRCIKLPPMCRCPMSDIIIGLTLILDQSPPWISQ